MTSPSLNQNTSCISFYTSGNALMNPCKDLILFTTKFNFDNTGPSIKIPPNWPFELNFDMSKASSINSFSGLDELTDEMYLLKLNPLKWKEQDHYKVLGLSSLRQNASSSDIRKAYQKMVLSYHPDKRQQLQGDMAHTYKEDSDLFKCIQRAYEILLDPQQRHAFDSVDPSFDESIPDVIAKKKLESDPLVFYKTFISVFEANARFSKIKPVPHLGYPSTHRSEVESFYNFWYNFESLRTFEYLDEEDTNQADNRYDKRYLEKKNKTARLKRKTEDNTRIRKLVDNAAQSDPRLKIFKEQDKKIKEEQKNLRKSSASKKLPSAVSNGSERLKSKQAEEAEKTRLLEIKKQKEAERALLKQARKEIRSKIKAHQFFTSSNISLLEQRIGLVENKLEKLTCIEHLNSFSTQITDEIAKCLETNDADTFYLNNFESDFSFSKKATEEKSYSIQESRVNTSEKIKPVEWTTVEVQCLIKACNTIPGGTKQRWEKIADYIREHANPSHTRTNEEFIEKSREIQNLGKLAFDNLDENELQNSLKKKLDPRISGDVHHVISTTSQESIIWTKAEQSLLEEGLRKYPPSNENRWDSIADMIPTKTMQQVINRFKEVVKSVKAAQQAK